MSSLKSETDLLKVLPLIWSLLPAFLNDFISKNVANKPTNTKDYIHYIKLIKKNRISEENKIISSLNCNFDQF